ncbi:RNA-binding protein 42-like [Anaeramoeba flamelloides]|uniref:RNA-binding protein 42-like n=1 Tax=Anaeramoeba flamelloides TaxID=1746091 RepID=A0AAV7Y9A1_9EUKA|nr:RNA-binding protein 42-like [Anaeramoeba flamelloides]
MAELDKEYEEFMKQLEMVENPKKISKPNKIETKEAKQKESIKKESIQQEPKKSQPQPKLIRSNIPKQNNKTNVVQIPIPKPNTNTNTNTNLNLIRQPEKKNVKPILVLQKETDPNRLKMISNEINTINSQIKSTNKKSTTIPILVRSNSKMNSNTNPRKRNFEESTTIKLAVLSQKPIHYDPKTGPTLEQSLLPKRADPTPNDSQWFQNLKQKEKRQEQGHEQEQVKEKIPTTKKKEQKEKEKKDKKPKKFLRVSDGKVWEDKTLAEWPENDFRIFVGNLGRDVNDDKLREAFNKFPSFQKSKVIRDRVSGKPKFGFVSFLDPNDFTAAMKMHGEYIGSRPIILKRSDWKKRKAFGGKGRKKGRGYRGRRRRK